MDESRVNTNGEINGWATAEENQSSPSYRRGSFPSPIQSNRGSDLQSLDSSFSRLSVRNQRVSLPDNRRSNRSPPFFNGGGGIGGGGDGYSYPQPSRDYQSQQIQNHSQTPPSLYNGGGFNGGGIGGNGGDGYYYPPPPPSSRESESQQTLNVPYLSRNNSMNNNVYNDVSASSPIVSRAKDRVYSLILQNQILEGSKETIDELFDDLIIHAFELIVDPFGNGVIQSLMEKCSSQQISQILDLVTQNSFRFLAICNDSLGTRVIQLLLRCLSTEEQVSRAVEAISGVALTLTKSNHAKHAILQCFSMFSPLQNRSLMEIIVKNCYRIAIDQHGCCMLQQCLNIGFDELKQRLIGEIITHALRLCVHCYGNYVVQYVVELNHGEVTRELINTLIGNYAYLSRNKYGSHAVQKLLKIKDIDTRIIVNDLLREIDSLLLDPFGNYVIQTAWLVSQDDIKHRLWLHIMSNCGYMRCNKFGKKILEKLYYDRNM
ncbi:unnamed protein product [Cochlearia groenlandica]